MNETFMLPDTTSEASPRRQLLRLGLMIVVALAGLCTIFALVATASQAWQERAETKWPEVTAHVENCSLEHTSYNRRGMQHIHCSLSFRAGAEENAADIYSTNVPSPGIPQYPPNQIQPFAEWVNAHPTGTPITLRYDPADATKIVLADNYMPQGGPRTPSNLKLLGACAGSFLILLMIARMARPPSSPNRDYSKPLNQ
jgi:hypothetical protein